MSQNALDEYRKLASFPLAGLVDVLEPDPRQRELKELIWRTIKSEPEFQVPKVTLAVEEQKRHTARMLRRLHVLIPRFIPPHDMKANYKKKVSYGLTLKAVKKLKNVRSLNDTCILIG